MLCVIDNYDSFTYNHVQYLGELGAPAKVVKNDSTSVESLASQTPSGFVLSPGPGGPTESGVCLEVLRVFGSRVPILGVCLGHQAIAHVFGGRVVRARRVMHGKESLVHHDSKGVFRGLPSPLCAGRYHSLVVETSLPESLRVTAATRSEDGAIEEIMGIRHVHFPIEGIQFHPESILTPEGRAILANFCDMVAAWPQRARARPGGAGVTSGGASSAAAT
jgi:anthranilate synthase component 2